jgi:hypothetical protein
MEKHHCSLVILLTLCVISGFLGAHCTAQENKGGRLPPDLKAVIDSRLSLFLSAQKNGQWDDVSTLLGDYRRGYFGQSLRFSKPHKACLISEMEKLPMISFDYSIEEPPVHTSGQSQNPEERWWWLEGEGTFQAGTRAVKQKTELTAYQDRGDWFFSPPPVDGADAIRERRKELSKDRKDEVDLVTIRDCPLEVVELRVLDDPQNDAARDVYFRLHNKTAMTVTRYGYKLTDKHKAGSISFGTGDAIAPNGVSREYHENYVVYRYWCEGAAKIRIEIDNAALADGSEWNASESDAPTP